MHTDDVRVVWTGPGTMPGTDSVEAARVIVGECPVVPFVPCLPARGIGSDAVGRTCALLADLPVDVSTRGWRLGTTTGRAGRRAVDVLDRDVDALTDAADAARDPVAPADPGRRVQWIVRGPWSLMATVELPGGLPVAADRGARSDLVEALAEGLAARPAEVSERMGAAARVVVDEPLLWSVIAGVLPSSSRLDPLPAVPAARAAGALFAFAARLRERGVAEVLLRPPALRPDGPPAHWSDLVDPPRGTAGPDGLVLARRDLRLGGEASARERAGHGGATGGGHRALLDAAGTVLGDGGLLQIEGVVGAGPAREPVGEPPALLAALGADPYRDLTRLVLAPDEAALGPDTAGAARALAGVGELARLLPRVAE